jgi:hypothetical protein
MTVQQRNLAAAVLVILGIIGVVIGVIWLTVEAKSLPSFLGQIHGATLHRSKRGTAAVIIGAVLLIGGIGLLWYRPRLSSSD